MSFCKIKWKGHAENLRKMRNGYKILVGNLKERPLWRLGIDGLDHKLKDVERIG
jgi:hypothetical protein